MRVLAVATLVAGCSFQAASAADGDVGQIPDSVDALSCVAWDAPNVLSCDPAIGSPTPVDIVAGNYTLDTDAGTLTGSGDPLSLPGAIVAEAGGLSVRVVNTTRLAIVAGANITVVGCARSWSSFMAMQRSTASSMDPPSCTAA